MSSWSGQDWALLLGGVTVFITGIGGFITSMVTLIRLGTVAAKVDGMLVVRDASNILAGTVIGRKAGDDASAERAEGRRQEREIIREATALVGHPEGAPVPVADERTAAAAENTAAATTRIAEAAERKK